MKPLLNETRREANPENEVREASRPGLETRSAIGGWKYEARGTFAAKSGDLEGSPFLKKTAL